MTYRCTLTIDTHTIELRDTTPTRLAIRASAVARQVRGETTAVLYRFDLPFAQYNGVAWTNI